MPKNHQYFNWNVDRFINWGKSIGPNTEIIIDKHIHRYKVEEQSYKGCMSILKLVDKYTAQRLENACTIALEHIPNPTYKNIRLILEAGQDEIQNLYTTDDKASKENAIIRGADYYRK